MEVFERAVRDSDSIPYTEEEHWISRINTDDENPVVALLLPCLYYLTSIKIAVTYITNIQLNLVLKCLVSEVR